jgi:dCTP deaminase
MFLARSRIEKLVFEAAPLFYGDTFESKCLQQSSYDLRLGTQAYLVGEDAPVLLTDDQQYLTIPPGQFAILTCFEKLDLPKNLMGFITLRNNLKMQGLVNISGFHVDPTFKGILIFAVNNAGPADIRLRFREPTFTIFFADVDGDIGEPRREQKVPLAGISLNNIQCLGGSSVTLTKLQKEVHELRIKMLIYAPLAVAALLALFLNLLRQH